MKTATTEQNVVSVFSDDEGKTWSKPASPFIPPSIEGKVGLFRALYFTSLGNSEVLATLAWVDGSDPSLPFFNQETEGLLDMKIFHAISEDGGISWSDPWRAQTSPFEMPTPSTGPTLVLPNGEWMCEFELNKHYYDTSEWRHASVLMFSRDGGGTWPEHTVVCADPDNRVFYWDQRPGVVSDGSILNLFWTFDRGESTYLNIHASKSVDSGRTWAPVWDTGVPGQPAQPVSLADGSIAMVYVDRTSAPAVKLRRSWDGARTWPEESEVVLHSSERAVSKRAETSLQEAWSEMEKFAVGLPQTALLPNGDLLVVYYAGTETDRTDICWVRMTSDD